MVALGSVDLDLPDGVSKIAAMAFAAQIFEGTGSDGDTITSCARKIEEYLTEGDKNG